MPAASTIKPEEREFVVDSGASTHMVSRKDLNSAELVTVRISKNPTTVLTEAKENARELDLIVVTLLEDTPTVLSLGKTLRGSWKNYHWTSGQKPQLIKKGKILDCNISNCVPFVVSGLSTKQALQAHLHSHLLHLHRRIL